MKIKSERILARSALKADPAEFRELSYRGPVFEPTPSAIFHTPERHLRLVMNRLIVYVNYA